MAKMMGGDLVLQLLQEFREHQQDYKGFKQEMLEFKQDYKGFKQEMLEFKQDYMGFKRDMLGFKQAMELRMDLLWQTNVETLGYLRHIVHILQPVRTRLDDHEERLTRLEKE